MSNKPLADYVKLPTFDEYKEWFKKANDLAQRGYIFFAFGDMCSCFHNDYKMLLNSEPPTGEYLEFPPAG